MRALILKIMFELKRWWAETVLIDVYLNLRCPGCGLVFPSVQNRTDFSTVYSKVMCKCPRCNAVWAQDPVIDHSKWKVESLDEVNLKAEHRAAESIRALQSRERDSGIIR